MSCISLWYCAPLDPSLEGLQGFCDDGLLWQLVPQPDGGREKDSLKMVVWQNGTLYRCWWPLVAAPVRLNWESSGKATRQ